jgi:hypothetical protein
MQLKFTRQFKLLIIFLIILGAVAFARMNSWFSKGASEDPVAFQTGREFKKAKNFIKTQLDFSVENLDSFLKEIDQISNNSAVNVIKKEQTSSSVIFLAEVSDTEYPMILAKIRNIPSIGSKKESSNKSTEFDKDLKQRLDINVALKNKYLADLQKAKQAYSSDRLREQLNNVQLTIDSLQTEIQAQEHKRHNNLIFLVVSPKVSGSKSLLLSTGSFATRFALGLLGFTILAFVIIFMMNFILRLMSMMGIHTAKGSGGKSYSSYKYGSKGSYSYGGYGSNRKRKIKRIYKDPTTGEKKEVTSTEDK